MKMKTSIYTLQLQILRRSGNDIIFTGLNDKLMIKREYKLKIFKKESF